MAKLAGAIPRRLLVGLGMLGLAACAEVGYTNPGVSEAEYLKDSEECAEIARHQAFRDQTVFDTQWRGSVALRHDRGDWGYRDTGPPSYGYLEFRYRRLCMLSRGYQIAPLEPDDEAEDDPQDKPQEKPQDKPQ
jgi:hypothetical protein